VHFPQLLGALRRRSPTLKWTRVARTGVCRFRLLSLPEPARLPGADCARPSNCRLGLALPGRPWRGGPEYEVGAKWQNLRAFFLKSKWFQTRKTTETEPRAVVVAGASFFDALFCGRVQNVALFGPAAAVWAAVFELCRTVVVICAPNYYVQTDF